MVQADTGKRKLPRAGAVPGCSSVSPAVLSRSSAPRTARVLTPRLTRPPGRPRCRTGTSTGLRARAGETRAQTQTAVLEGESAAAARPVPDLRGHRQLEWRRPEMLSPGGDQRKSDIRDHLRAAAASCSTAQGLVDCLYSAVESTVVSASERA